MFFILQIKNIQYVSLFFIVEKERNYAGDGRNTE